MLQLDVATPSKIRGFILNFEPEMRKDIALRFQGNIIDLTSKNFQEFEWISDEHIASRFNSPRPL